MQFVVDHDSGDSLVGWVVPDNPSATPVLAVQVQSHPPVRLPANVFRQDLKDLGKHNTGMVGFRIDRTIVPDLKGGDEVEIREAETGILIYRRFQSDKHLERKLMRYELTAMPQLTIDAACASHFALNYQAVERYGYDTLFAIINNPKATSSYISGRPFLTRYIQLLRDRGYKTVVVLRDPIEELAERLVFLKFAAGQSRPDFVLNHLTGLTPLLQIAPQLDINDEKALAAALGRLSDEERFALANPCVRTIACAVDEMPDSNHVSIALENLANLDLVGLQSRYGLFRTDMQNLFGVDILGDQKPAAISSVPALARKLGKMRAVHRLLALDIKLYRFATEAVDKAYG